jgi:hypothetical protein
MLRQKNLEMIVQTRKKNQTGCREIETNPSKDRAMHEGDDPSFWNESIEFDFYLTVKFIFVFSCKYMYRNT